MTAVASRHPENQANNNVQIPERTQRSRGRWGIRVRPRYVHELSDPQNCLEKAAIIFSSVVIPPLGAFNLYKYLELYRITEDIPSRLYFELVQKGYLDQAREITDANNGILNRTYQSKKFIFWCIDTDSRERIEFLIQKGASFATTDAEGLSPLHYALKKGKLTAFQAALQAQDVSLRVILPWTNETLLHVIAKKGYTSVCEPLLNAIGNDPLFINRIDIIGRTAIWVALELDRQSIFQSLVRRGATDLTVQQGDKTLFHRSLESSCNSYFSQLMRAWRIRPERDPEILDRKDSRGRTAAFVALDYDKDPSILQVLMQAGINLEEVDPETEETLLHKFAKKNDSASCSIFIEEARRRGVLAQVIDQTDREGRTALFLAARKNHHNIVQQLLEGGANCAQRIHGREVLDVARRQLPCQQQSQRLLENALHGRLREPVEGEHRGYTREQALFRSIRDRNFPQTIRLVCEANLETLDESGNGPFLLVIKSGFSESQKLELIRLIRNRGDDVKRINASGESLLILAAEKKYDTIIEELLIARTDPAKNVDLDLVDNLGNTALHHAVLQEDFNAMQLLVRARAQTNMQNNAGRTPLHLAPSEQIAAFLLRVGGADSEIRDDMGLRILDIAATQVGRDALIRTIGSYSTELAPHERAEWNENRRAAAALRAHAHNGDIRHEDIPRLHEEPSESLAGFGRNVRRHAASEAEALTMRGVTGTAEMARNIGSAVRTTVEDTVVGTLATVNLGGRAANAGSQVVGALLERGTEAAMRRINGNGS